MLQWLEVDQIRPFRVVQQVTKACLVPQACNTDNRYVTGDFQWTPIPDQLTQSVAVDVFSMPEVHFAEKAFNCVVLFVDC